MGLDAMVRCRCGRDCAHAEHALASVHVATWPDYRLFQHALREAGRHHFPVLCAELPETGAGTLSPDRAAAALAELRYFVEHADPGAQTWLIDDRTDAMIVAAVPSYAGVLVWAGRSRHKLGADPHGFFVRRIGVDDREAFRAQCFTQDVLEDDWVRFTDIDTDATLAVALRAPLGDCAGRYPRTLRVDTVLVTAADFRPIVDPLTAVLELSTTTDSPVTWR